MSLQMWAVGLPVNSKSSQDASRECSCLNPWSLVLSAEIVRGSDMARLTLAENLQSCVNCHACKGRVGQESAVE